MKKIAEIEMLAIFEEHKPVLPTCLKVLANFIALPSEIANSSDIDLQFLISVLLYFQSI
jgi:hypothetical protein